MCAIYCLFSNSDFTVAMSSSSSSGTELDSSETGVKRGLNSPNRETQNSSLSQNKEPPRKKIKQTTDDKSGTWPLIEPKTSIDCSVEVYPIGHTKRSYCRHTVISLLDLNAELPKAQKEIKAKYGILEDASRSGIGDFKLDLGIKSHNDSKVFTAQSQTKWSNLVGKVKNGLNNYSVVGNYI